MYGFLNWILNNLGSFMVPAIIVISMLVKDKNKSHIRPKKSNNNLEAIKKIGQSKIHERNKSGQIRELKENKQSIKSTNDSTQALLSRKSQKQPLEPEVSYYDRVYEKFTADKVTQGQPIYAEKNFKSNKYDKFTGIEITTPEAPRVRKNTLKKAVIYSEILGKPRAINKFNYNKH